MSKYKWKLSNETYEFIKGEVIHIFEKYSIKCIPVSGFEIASKMKLSLLPYSSLSKKKLEAAMTVSRDGFFIEFDGRECIYYNDIERCYKRQNWTILHEIGHIVLDHSGYGELEEDEANFFAKYAIAPPVLVHKVGAKGPHDIYEIFDISFEASIYSFEYYCSWKAHYNMTKRLTAYEKRLLALYSASIQ
ncbi:ImmA/IrrE family metallo-endopeptidase [Sharpea porci]|uniref:ImmA/IrrE family metallo-endopeptidase n=1 Tax=Sharpea porci TaxID=2652286 RepID=UPI00240A94E8|nr:ImmA/IrrE family metallo-endopeptidase [Sharpea porci]MDD6711517.1 ImmA/IrrE family metallo-endopeptidase [Sharpea porci]MDY5278466.1 ImmA/IrrE family metallo-endopeptidase [Sharpea porci]